MSFRYELYNAKEQNTHKFPAKLTQREEKYSWYPVLGSHPQFS